MKANLDYVIRSVTAPGETERSLIPAIVNRIPSKPLSAVISNAIKNNLIAGLQTSAVAGIAAGLADQIYDTLCEGRGVRFGSYFYVRPYLTGLTDANGALAKRENGIDATLVAGPDFALTLDDFSLHFAGRDSLPKIDSVTYNGAGADIGEMMKGKKALVNGSLLVVSESDDAKVTFTEVGGGEEAVEVTSFDAKGAQLLEFDAPAALVAGRRYSVQVERSASGGDVRVSNTRTVTVKQGETPPVVNPPLIESVESQNEPEDTVNLGGAYLFVYGDNLDTATEVKVYNSHDEVVATVPVTFVPAGEMIPARLESTSQVAVEYTPEGGSENGKVEVTTAGGTNAKTVTLVSH